MSNAEIDLNTVPLPADPAEPSSQVAAEPAPLRTFTPPTFDDVVSPQNTAPTTPKPTATTMTANKAHVGAILGTITAAATAAATQLPAPYSEYVTGGVIIVGVVASWFGIYFTRNRQIV